ncbi:MAG: ATP-binding protein [Mycobacteriales bacterium]
MRGRIVRSTLGVVAVAIFALGLPLLFVSLRLIADTARTDLLREAQTVQSYVESRVQASRPVTGEVGELLPEGDHVTITMPRKAPLEVGPKPPRHRITQTVALGTGGTVVVSRPSDYVRNRVVQVAVLIGLVAITAAAIAAVVAIVVARRLAVPMLEVADRAARLGDGDFRSVAQRHGVPELDRVSDVLDRSAAEIAELVRRERDLASDVSHQIRSRLTALSMRLEELTLHGDPDVREEAQLALEQAERLEGVVTELLAHARNRRTAAATWLELRDEIGTIVGEYEPAVQRAGREIDIECDRGLRAVATPGRLHQALGGLVDNAVEHGAGRILVRASSTGRSAVIEVSDEGDGVPADLVGRIFERGVSGRSSTGLGLALSRALVEADGGRLELRQARPPVFVIYLGRIEPR